MAHLESWFMLRNIHTAQIRVATGLFSPDLHEELILSAAEGRHRRARGGVALCRAAGAAKDRDLSL